MRNQFNKLVLIVAAGVLLGGSSPLLAQSNGVDRVKVNEIHNQTAVSIEPAVKPFSLIDLSKLSWSHSYSMTFGSNSFGSAGLGMYTGALLYEFSPKLSMQFALGVAQNLSGNAVNSSGDLFPSFSLDYHPSDKFRLLVNVQRSPYSSFNSGRFSGNRNFGGFGSSLGGGYGLRGNSF